MELGNYVWLLEQFSAHKISVRELTTRYFRAFKSETGGMDPAVYDVLNSVFTDLDCYSPRCAPGEETDFRISEQKLRANVEIALHRIQELLEAKG